MYTIDKRDLLEIIIFINAVDIIAAIRTVFLAFSYLCTTYRTIHSFHLKR